jgi:impB/mucB/samB family protein
VEGLALRAARRMRPFHFAAAALSVEVRRPDGTLRRSETFQPPVSSEDTLRAVAAGLAGPLFDEAVAGVRGIQIRLSRLGPIDTQAPLPLFPERRRQARTR